MVHELNGKDFDAFLAKNPRVLVDFSATWCGPCRMLTPVLDRFAAENPGKVEVVKVMVWSRQGDSADNDAIAERFRVQAVPTLVYFESGAEKTRDVGVVPMERLKGMCGL